MMTVAKTARLPVSNRARSVSVVVFMVTLIAISSAQDVTWTKVPKNPSYGVAGEKVVLHWGYNLTVAPGDAFDRFVIRRWNSTSDDYNDIVKYGSDGKEIVFPDHKGRFSLAKNATPALLLIKAEKSDEREYCCKVSTKKLPGKQKCTKLIILVRPSITGISQNQTMNETDDIILSCQATGTPTPNITWYRRGKGGWRHPEPLLSLKNVSRDQTGEYRCTATNDAGNDTATVLVTVNYPPWITPPAKNYNFTEGNDIHLECVSGGQPPPTITWAKSGGPLNVAYPPGRELIIRNANRTEAGTYTCTATNGIGNHVSASVNVKGFYVPSIVSKLFTQTLNETQELRLVCMATGSPPPGITWSKRTGARLLNSVDGVFSVGNVSKSDAGIYQCTAFNGIGNGAIALSTVIVNYKPVGTKVTSDARNNAVMVDQAVTFTCSAESLPPPQLELRFNNKTLGMFQNGTFALRVNVSNEGEYQCIPRNFLGTGPTAHLNLTVFVSPLIDSISSNITVNETDDVTLFCNASGKPLPSIKWYFLGNTLKMISDANETLFLRRVNRSQAGSYRCTAENGNGKPAVAEVKVTINYQPEIKNGSQREIISWENHETEMTCAAEGFPVPEITWSRNGVELPSTQPQNPVRSKLIITPQEAEDFGLYVCVAKNLLGTATMKIAVKPLAVPLPPEIVKIEKGLNKLEIHWKELVTDPKYPILNYLVQIKKGESQKWMNCTSIETEGNSKRCVIEDLETADYIVRVSARNAAGYSEFTVRKVSTQESPGTTDKQRAGLSKRAITWIIGGAIGLASLLVIVLAIVISCKRRRSSSTGANSDLQAHESSKKVTITSHDNPTMENSPESTDGP